MQEARLQTFDENSAVALTTGGCEAWPARCTAGLDADTSLAEDMTMLPGAGGVQAGCDSRLLRPAGETQQLI